MQIQMVDLKGQYQRLKSEIDNAIQKVLDDTTFINGPSVASFSKNLASYLDVKYVIPCANGTDALQIALMAINAKPGDEVIIPAFTYVATAEVIALLGLIPVMVDVDPDNFNIDINTIESKITAKTIAIVPVHLFGQCSDMEDIMRIANLHNLYVIEDNAQAIGGHCTVNGVTKANGTIGHIGCTSFFPSKNLGCYGDGGAMFTNYEELATRLKMMANHGQSKVRYIHESVGVNSRLDSIQASILDVKLQYLDDFIASRQKFAAHYNDRFKSISWIDTPKVESYTDHVYHQYTIKISGKGRRDALKAHLADFNVPCAVYYPIPLYDQIAYKPYFKGNLPVTEQLCATVLSLPIHSEYDVDMVDYICDKLTCF
jgi:UDP-2-acetamido-2-deoxy-ribo-hexuluronate aminotransferase